jgi:hypothetical protein
MQQSNYMHITQRAVGSGANTWNCIDAWQNGNLTAKSKLRLDADF